VRANWILRWGFTAFMAIPFLILGDWTASASNAGDIALGLFGLAFCLFLWLVGFVGSRPPIVKVTAGQVSVPDVDNWPIPRRMPRSDLASIFRGQARWGRVPAWRPAYFFVTRDGTPQNTVSAEDFADDGFIELAKRLQVPIQGDFTAQVAEA
jgi:hypothetical protein